MGSSSIRLLTLYQQHSDVSFTLFGQTEGKRGCGEVCKRVRGIFHSILSHWIQSTNLLENIFLQIPPGTSYSHFLTVAGAGWATLWPVKQVIPKHIFCLRVMASTFRVSPGHTTAPGPHTKARPRVLWRWAKFTQHSPTPNLQNHLLLPPSNRPNQLPGAVENSQSRAPDANC